MNGDLIVRINVLHHEQFKRDGVDIFYDAHIGMIDATIGKIIQVPTLENAEKIKIESGSQPNTLIKLKGKGLPKQGFIGGRGDQYVRLIIDIPKKLNKHQKNILEEFDNTFD